jgi:hypothetical protein
MRVEGDRYQIVIFVGGAPPVWRDMVYITGQGQRGRPKSRKGLTP